MSTIERVGLRGDPSDVYVTHHIARRRPRVTDDDVTIAGGRLTDRDRAIVHLVHRARVLTTDQIREVFFDNPTTARHRLAVLYQLRLLDRFQPPLELGSAPFHWMVDHLGAMVVAVDQDRDPDVLRFSRSRLLATARSSHLAHRVAANGFFTALLAAARRQPGAELVRWWPEARCSHWAPSLVVPDGYGVWRDGAQLVEFVLELDRHTEPRRRLVAKLDAYATLHEAARRSIPVLFCFGSERREASVRQVLGDPPVPVATAALTGNQAPHEAHWLPVGSAGPRLPLVELADLAQAFTPVGGWPEPAYPASYYRGNEPPDPFAPADRWDEAEEAWPAPRYPG